MRQAWPDDAIVLIGLPVIRELWSSVERYLGRSRAFWTCLLPIVGESEPRLDLLSNLPDQSVVLSTRTMLVARLRASDYARCVNRITQ
jgi:hypothetical protein